MGNDFYERQINQLNSNEAIREINGFVEDYLKAGTTEDANNIKELIIQKAIQELSAKEIRAVRDSISERAKSESGKVKARLYELAAGLYRVTDPRNAPQLNQFPNSPEVFDYPPFSIAAGGGIDGYEIIGGKITNIGNGNYKVVLEGSKKQNKLITRKTQVEFIIGYNGPNVLAIYDENGRAIGRINIRNRNESVETGRLHRDNRGYSRRFEDRNAFITLPPFKVYGRTVHGLTLSLNDR